MISHSFETKVYYFDTDSYNIVWHGTYLKWFEIGRVEFFNLIGEDLDNMDKDNTLFPMVNLSVRYKSPARFADVLIINTTLEKLSKICIGFKHEVIRKLDEKLLVVGHTEVVITDSNGKLLKKMPDNLYKKFSDCLLS